MAEFELGILLSEYIETLKKNKIKVFFIYIFIVLYLSLPAFQIPLLEIQNRRFSSLMEQRAYEDYLLSYPRQSWVSIDDVNPSLIKGIISMEDGNFYRHRGVDWKELKTSIALNKRVKRSKRGGSTITMQLAKNLFLTTDKSVIRKAKELLITFRIEKEVSKKAILENYVNIIEWGNGVFGIGKASDIFFDKDPDKLTGAECSRLAAVIPSPLKHPPNENSRYVRRRSSIISNRMNNVQLEEE
ncbi:MAG: monofunctional biosynthetic peptidoglycan transglycosylase [Ignavibacteriaceae bacterium]